MGPNEPRLDSKRSKPYTEAGRFVIRIELAAEFDDDYEGDDDGYAWLERFRDHVRPRLARAVFAELRAEPGFDAVPSTRGQSPDEELEITVRFRPPPTARAAPSAGGDER